MADDVDRLWVESMPEAYEQGLVPTVFRPFALDLARRVRAHGPRRVLELAAGTGVLTRELVAALQPGCDVVATDLNAAMVEYGTTQVPQATWKQADATRLPFGQDEFDVITAQFGVMFFPDKHAAFAEARRVLSGEGTFVFSTWAAVETHDFQSAMVDALQQVFPDEPPTFFATMPHGYADPDAVVSDLRAAGFPHVDVEAVTCEGRAGSAYALAVGYCSGTPLRAAIEARADLQSTTATIAKRLESRFGTGEVTGSMTGYVFEAGEAG